MYKMKVKAISPIIAIIIVVAITLAIAFAVVGWLFGLWGGIAGGTPQIQITNAEAFIKKENNEENLIIRFYVINKGTGSDRVLQIRVSKGTQSKVITGNNILTYGQNPTDVIPANFNGWVNVTVADVGGWKVSLGDSLLVKIYFEKSGVQTIPVTVVGQETQQ